MWTPDAYIMRARLRLRLERRLHPFLVGDL
jgi:hypothetical protein